ncbi:hypothetical protein OVA11_18345 [Caulobacter sp. SL161]|uniref:hypothetical protein n=1 Tax=Caulobacter sp. SL161 TaxID=2995156 RepID=UPI0022729A1F|nr:hypothetical protein [Caulobacter sp. SL161]MCY1648943.1 hypothetical protein [Caulobacter sp. SL161]
MKTLTALMTGATLIALTPTLVAADDLRLAFPVHNITVTSDIPALSISVRNQSQSTNPAQRDLRVVSPKPVLHVTGEVRCKSFPNANTRADAAQVIFGSGVLTPSGDKAIAFVGGWSISPVVELGDDQEARNFSINVPVNLPSTGAPYSVGFNPVHYVEARMQTFVQNGAGSQADFLRADDVFETTIRMNVVGWCEYQSQSLYGRYAGVRQMTVPVRIFYHGDPDIKDQTVGVGTPNGLQAPPPGRAPSRATPPARRTPPTRESQPEARSPTGAATGEVYGDGAVRLLRPAAQQMRESPAAPTGETGCNGAAPVLRREAARAMASLLLGSSRSRGEAERPSLQNRLVDTVVDQAAGCRPATADAN